MDPRLNLGLARRARNRFTNFDPGTPAAAQRWACAAYRAVAAFADRVGEQGQAECRAADADTGQEHGAARVDGYRGGQADSDSGGHWEAAAAACNSHQTACLGSFQLPAPDLIGLRQAPSFFLKGGGDRSSS